MESPDGDNVEPKELFISYGREPHVRSFVCRLKSDLEQNGFTVWLDLQVTYNEIDTN